MSEELPVRVWITVDYRPPEHLGPSFHVASEVRSGLREAGIPSYLFAVERDLASLRSTEDHREVVFPVEETYAHPGYDGDPVGLRRALEELDLPFVGSGSEAVLRAGEKDVAKDILRTAGLDVPGGVCLRDPATAGREVEDFLDRFPGPAVIKPVSGRGGSLGVEYLPDEASLRQAVERWAERSEGPVLIEEYIAGVEATAWVLGTGPDLRCPGAVEIPKASPIYDRASKSGQGGFLGGLPMPQGLSLSAADREAVTAAAVRAHRALGAYSYSRTDFIVRDGRPVILELNTRPTLGSLGAMAISDGLPLSFGEVLAELVGHAFARPPRNEA